jgi:glycosyltransferase involved in cell wall biosynthesis
MKQRMWSVGVDPLAVPNGLPSDAFEEPHPAGVRAFRGRLRGRTILAKLARWHPDKRWATSLAIVAEIKRRGWRPLLIARGGDEPYGGEMRSLARSLGLRWADRPLAGGADEAGILAAIEQTGEADIVHLSAHIGPTPKRLLFHSADAVLANSVHEPFGLVGLEAMAVGGLACTGCSGEDYVLPGQNALMLETDDPREFLQLYASLRSDPGAARALRRAARWTARRFAWVEVIGRTLLPRLAGSGFPVAAPGASRAAGEPVERRTHRPAGTVMPAGTPRRGNGHLGARRRVAVFPPAD